MLTGKYIDGTASPSSRLMLFPQMARYSGERSRKATAKYLQLAKDNNISLAHMALAFVNQQPFLTSNIIGATNLEQLKENIDSIHIDLSKELLKKINTIHAEIPNPAP
jgi:aryl-alcohol dehydrogenase-like predicted oxidoreductase